MQCRFGRFALVIFPADLRIQATKKNTVCEKNGRGGSPADSPWLFFCRIPPFRRKKTVSAAKGAKRNVSRLALVIFRQIGPSWRDGKQCLRKKNERSATSTNSPSGRPKDQRLRRKQTEGRFGGFALFSSPGELTHEAEKKPTFAKITNDVSPWQTRLGFFLASANSILQAERTTCRGKREPSGISADSPMLFLWQS